MRPWIIGVLIALASAWVCPAADVGRPLPYVQMGPNLPQTSTVSPDGRWLASGDLDGVRLYDLFMDREVRTLPYSGARKLVFLSAGKILITSGSSSYGMTSSLRFWD